MFWNAKNMKIQIDGDETDYVSFGNGKENLIILPGLGDGIKNVKGVALPFAFMYRAFAKKYKVYVFSRKNNLPKAYSTREMAADIHNVMQKLGIQKAAVMGISMGGMIAQYLAIDYPESVSKLVLTVTLAKQNDTIQQVGKSWVSMAKAGDYSGLMLDTAKKSYSDSFQKRNRLMIFLSTKIGKPKNFKRFITLAHACMEHDAFDELAGIQCPTFVIGGKQDKIVTGDASIELAKQIKNSRLLMYEQFGHGLYEEAHDFIDEVLKFLSVGKGV